MRYLSKFPVLRFFSALTLYRENATAYSYRLLRWLVLSKKNKKIYAYFYLHAYPNPRISNFSKEPVAFVPQRPEGGRKISGTGFHDACRLQGWSFGVHITHRCSASTTSRDKGEGQAGA